jgi:hypothetical protein
VPRDLLRILGGSVSVGLPVVIDSPDLLDVRQQVAYR